MCTVLSLYAKLLNLRLRQQMAEIAEAQTSVTRSEDEVERLRAETATLRAENEQLRDDIHQLHIIVSGLRLQAEANGAALVAVHRTLVAVTEPREIDLRESPERELSYVERVVNPVTIPPTPPLRPPFRRGPQ